MIAIISCSRGVQHRLAGFHCHETMRVTSKTLVCHDCEYPILSATTVLIDLFLARNTCMATSLKWQFYDCEIRLLKKISRALAVGPI